MASTRSQDPPPKKRTFFSSAVPLPLLAPASTPTSSTKAPASDKVLAALHAPDDNAKTETPERAIRPRKAKEIGEGSADVPASEEVLGRGSRRISAARQSNGNDGDGDAKDTPATKAKKRATQAKSTRTVGTPILVKNTGDKAEIAHSTNEALVAAMMKGMRASIGGAEVPYTRGSVWKVGEDGENIKVGGGEGDSAVLKKRGRAVKGVGVNAKVGLKNRKGKRGGKGKRKAKDSDEDSEEEEEEEDEEDEEGEENEEDQGQEGEEAEGDVPAKQKPKKKEYLSAGFYCQDDKAPSPQKLVNRVLKRRELEELAKEKAAKGEVEAPAEPSNARPKRAVTMPKVTGNDDAFPPLPYDHGYEMFFGQEHEFVLPYNISFDALEGKLDGKKKPTPYTKIRSNTFPEREKVKADFPAVCKCEVDSGCGDNCINRVMGYLCGKECPCGEKCTNTALHKRERPDTKVIYTGARGFGLAPTVNVKKGDFVTDYRGEIISLDLFHERCDEEYKGTKNFYALAYDQDEVIDAGMRGNEARFINHGCMPNLEVRKMQIEGLDEYEIGLWASRDIKPGEELFYDYRFTNFAAAETEDLRTLCKCGSLFCLGFLGRGPGEKSGKVSPVPPGEGAVGKKKKKTSTKPRNPTKVKVGISKKVTIRVKQVKKGSNSPHLETAEGEEGNYLPIAGLVDGDNEVGPSGTNGDELNAEELAAISLLATPGRLSSGAATTDAPGDADTDTPETKAAKAAALKRKSGWAMWLKKKAGERPHTIEEWHEERIKRRRGIEWMNAMIQEYGLSPSPALTAEGAAAYIEGKPMGSKASFANTLAALGIGEGEVRRLGGPDKKKKDGNAVPGENGTETLAGLEMGETSEVIMAAIRASRAAGPSGTSGLADVDDSQAGPGEINYWKTDQEIPREEPYEGQMVTEGSAPDNDHFVPIAGMPVVEDPPISNEMVSELYAAIPAEYNELNGPNPNIEYDFSHFGGDTNPYHDYTTPAAKRSVEDGAPQSAGKRPRLEDGTGGDLIPQQDDTMPVALSEDMFLPIDPSQQGITEPAPNTLIYDFSYPQPEVPTSTPYYGHTGPPPQSSNVAARERDNQKIQEIARRNGAPKGYAYVSDPAQGMQGGNGQTQVEELARGARKARISGARDEVPGRKVGL